MNKRLNESGAVSMITVIFIAVVLTVITTSFIRLTINEQRESIDDDLTTRAYYAAESGVQDAIASIKDGTVDDSRSEICTPNTGDGVLSSDSALDTSYTCQLIDLSPNEYQAYIEDGDSRTFKVQTETNSVDNIQIGWHIYGDSVNYDGTDVALRDNTELPIKSEWRDASDPTSILTYPAMVRLQIFSVPEAGVTRDNIENYVSFLTPHSAGSASIALPAFDGGVRPADCSLAAIDTGNYVCNVTITGIDDANRDYYVRVQSIYTGTNIEIQARDGSDNPLSIVDAQAVIDVTGRAGDVFRRVEERIDLSIDELWPDYAVLSAGDICKNFIITDVVSSGNPDIADFAAVNPGIVGSCN